MLLLSPKRGLSESGWCHQRPNEDRPIKGGWDYFPVERREAYRVQEALRRRVRRLSFPGPVERVAGVDAAFSQDRVVAVVSVLSYPELKVVEEGVGVQPKKISYIPGLLSFREGPAILAAIESLSRIPDLLLFDGQGIAHPRRLGIASHIGVLLDQPTIGVGKSRLVGHADEGRLAQEKGAQTPLAHNEEVLGGVLRSRSGVRPLYVSPGHRITVSDALAWTLACCTGYRLPEPVRLADRAAGREKRRLQGEAPAAPERRDQ